jgi:hypothetical protein
MTMDGILRLQRLKVTGGGDEWYLTTRDELLAIYRGLPAPRHESQNEQDQPDLSIGL